MPPPIDVRATLDDLDQVEGKAELIGGKVVRLMGTGRRPSLVAGQIYRSLFGHAEATGRGEVHSDGMTFGVPELASGGESFMPGVACYVGPLPSDEMRWIDDSPSFAVEVRSFGDYGPAAEAEMEAKRADYFEAGTTIVWDVDPVDDLIHVYRRDSPSTPTTHGRGMAAEAEPVVDGWRLDVNQVFGPDARV